MDSNTHDTVYHAAERRDMLKHLPVHLRTFLEIGCGEGNFSRLVKITRSAEVWGIEANETAAAIARRKLDRLISGTIEENINLLPDHFFDCIAMNDVIEHLISPWDVLEQLKRKLCKDGVIALSIPNFRYWKNLREIVVRGEWRYVESGILDRTHLRFFTYKSILRMMKELRFEVVTIEPIDERGKAIVTVLNALFLFRLWDLKYVHFACVVRPANRP